MAFLKSERAICCEPIDTMTLQGIESMEVIGGSNPSLAAKRKKVPFWGFFSFVAPSELFEPLMFRWWLDGAAENRGERRRAATAARRARA